MHGALPHEIAELKESEALGLESIELLRPSLVAEILDVDVATLAGWRSTRRKDLPFVKFGHRSVRYRRADVVAFIVRHLVQASALDRAAA